MSFPPQPFGFVAGRWVRSIGDTPDDPDRAPDYVPVKGTVVVFTPQATHRVAADGSGWAGIIKDRISGSVGERGQLIDAEGHDHLALAAGIYSVSYDFGPGNSWPSHYIEVKTEHTAEAPLWLPPIAPPAEGPMIENRVVTIPAGGRDGQVLVWDGAAFSWDYPPTGPQGPKGDMAVEQLAGAPRLTNEAHDMEWISATGGNSIIDSQTDRLVKFTATAQNGFIRRFDTIASGASYYYSAEVKATSDQVLFGSSTAPVYHSGSGDWERLTGTVTLTGGNTWFLVRDTRESGWDQVEVRDPVLIDLTAVFGAGREPTKEYMDALMAKHGNYIGGVDQFAVGDALHALTLAGQGMALRHDNSVGERVLLDHPGGSTMLHGDTGWRDISSLLENGWTGNAWIRRDTNLVTLRVHALSPATATSTTFLLPVQGFGWSRANSRGPRPVFHEATSPITFRRFVGTTNSMTDQSAVPAQVTLYGDTSWHSNDPWPDALPGTPA